MALAVAAAGLVACDADESADPQRETLHIGAASSVAPVMAQLADAFSATHPDFQVIVETGDSASLAADLQNGADLQILMLASDETMQPAVDAGLVRDVEVFASNIPTLAVPRGNPAGIDSVADLDRPGIRLTLCDEQIPCGVVAAKVLADAQVTVSPDWREPDVRSVLNRVRSGKADVGIVFYSEIHGASREVEEIPIADAEQAATHYPIGVAADTTGPQLDAAQDFHELVLSEQGQQILRDGGFAAAD